MSPSNWKERDFIELIKQGAKKSSTHLVKGIGDDCAVVSSFPEKQWLVTADMLVDGIHFNTSWHPPELLGRKCIAVSLSDIAAMGGEPLLVFISIAIPDQLSDSWLKRWGEGVNTILDEYDCTLAGGDTVRGTELNISVTIMGVVEEGRSVHRDSAGVGENIYVSGALGSAAAGLLSFSTAQIEQTLPAEELEVLRERHLNPSPDIMCGRVLGASGLVTAMQDLSDGLATDLSHICSQSSLGAEIIAASLPYDTGLHRLCELAQVDPVYLQVSGGEDFHLVFTVKRGGDAELMSIIEQHPSLSIFHVGRTVAEPGVRLLSEKGSTDITFKGYQHTSAPSPIAD